MIMDTWEFNNPILLIMMYRGIRRSMDGNICTTISVAEKKVLPRNRKREMTYPENSATKSAIPMVAQDTSMDLTKYVLKYALFQIFP